MIVVFSRDGLAARFEVSKCPQSPLQRGVLGLRKEGLDQPEIEGIMDDDQVNAAN